MQAGIPSGGASMRTHSQGRTIRSPSTKQVSDPVQDGLQISPNKRKNYAEELLYRDISPAMDSTEHVQLSAEDCSPGLGIVAPSERIVSMEQHNEVAGVDQIGERKRLKKAHQTTGILSSVVARLPRDHPCHAEDEETLMSLNTNVQLLASTTLLSNSQDKSPIRNTHLVHISSDACSYSEYANRNRSQSDSVEGTAALVQYVSQKGSSFSGSPFNGATDDFIPNASPSDEEILVWCKLTREQLESCVDFVDPFARSWALSYFFRFMRVFIRVNNKTPPGTIVQLEAQAKDLKKIGFPTTKFISKLDNARQVLEERRKEIVARIPITKTLAEMRLQIKHLVAQFDEMKLMVDSPLPSYEARLEELATMCQEDPENEAG